MLPSSCFSLKDSISTTNSCSWKKVTPIQVRCWQKVPKTYWNDYEVPLKPGVVVPPKTPKYTDSIIHTVPKKNVIQISTCWCPCNSSHRLHWYCQLLGASLVPLKQRERCSHNAFCAPQPSVPCLRIWTPTSACCDETPWDFEPNRLSGKCFGKNHGRFGGGYLNDFTLCI